MDNNNIQLNEEDKQSIVEYLQALQSIKDRTTEG